MKIYSVNDKEFNRFGKVLNLDTAEIVRVGEGVAMPESGSAYIASLDAFECLKIKQTIQNECFGGIDAQIGYCYGFNDTLNALEWHKCSEINVAVTDIILLLGDIRDLENGNRYDSSKVKAFRVKKGEAIEVYATTLHYCPIQTSDDGFGCVVALIKDTNTPLESKSDDKLLFAKNKWLISHVDNESLIKKGAFAGVYGENYKL